MSEATVLEHNARHVLTAVEVGTVKTVILFDARASPAAIEENAIDAALACLAARERVARSSEDPPEQARTDGGTRQVEPITPEGDLVRHALPDLEVGDRIRVAWDDHEQRHTAAGPIAAIRARGDGPWAVRLDTDPPLRVDRGGAVARRRDDGWVDAGWGARIQRGTR